MPYNNENKPSSPQEVTINFGAYLQRERLRQGLPLETIAKGTGIKVATLAALEAGDRRNLPADVFNRGFIKLYAGVLQIDPQEALDSYEKEWGFSNGLEGSNLYITGQAMAEPTSPFADKQVLTFLAIVFLAATVFLVSYVFNQHKKAQKVAPPLSYRELRLPSPPAAESLRMASEPPAAFDSTAYEEVDMPLAAPFSEEEDLGHAPLDPAFEEHPAPQTSDDSPSPGPDDHSLKEEARPAPAEQADVTTRQDEAIRQEEATRGANEQYTLQATFSERTWLRMTIDHQEDDEYIFNPGERHTWLATDSFQLLIGNSGGLQLTLNGIPVQMTNKSGQVTTLTLP